MECPACGCYRRIKPYDKKAIGLSTVYRCPDCGAVFGSCYLGDSYQIVKHRWYRDVAKPEDTFYYDLTCVGSEGVTRRHGWAHKETREIVQTG